MIAGLEQLTVFDEGLPHHGGISGKEQMLCRPHGKPLESWFHPQSLTLRDLTLDLTSDSRFEYRVSLSLAVTHLKDHSPLTFQKTRLCRETR